MNGHKPPQLDDRLKTACRMASDCKCFADIGADHGKLSSVLLYQNSHRKALVSDISDKALQKARARISWLGLENQVTFSVSDGLLALSETGFLADTVFILGMGGDTISGILRNGAIFLNGAELILSAHTELPLLRRTVEAIGYRIRDEKLAVAQGRTYLLMRCNASYPCEEPYSETELLFGPCLLRDKPSEWKPVLERQCRRLRRAASSMASSSNERDLSRLEQFREELKETERILSDLEECERDRKAGAGMDAGAGSL